MPRPRTSSLIGIYLAVWFATLFGSHWFADDLLAWFVDVFEPLGPHVSVILSWLPLGLVFLLFALIQFRGSDPPRLPRRAGAWFVAAGLVWALTLAVQFGVAYTRRRSASPLYQALAETPIGSAFATGLLAAFVPALMWMFPFMVGRWVAGKVRGRPVTFKTALEGMSPKASRVFGVGVGVSTVAGLVLALLAV